MRYRQIDDDDVKAIYDEEELAILIRFRRMTDPQFNQLCKEFPDNVLNALGMELFE